MIFSESCFEPCIAQEIKTIVFSVTHLGLRNLAFFVVITLESNTFNL